MSIKMDNKFVAGSLPELYLKSDLADVFFEFTTDDQTEKVPAHKAILAVASSVFRAMFFGPIKENGVVQMVDMDVSAFKEFLQLFYLPEVTLTMDNVEDVVQLVDKYDMHQCLKTCADILEYNLTRENMFWGYHLAIAMNNQKLKEFCEREITHFTRDNFKSDSFLHCNRDILQNTLQLQYLSCNEVELFETCIEWAKISCEVNELDGNDPENLKEQLGECFYLIQFHTMTDMEYGTILSNKLYRRMFNRDELADIQCMKSSETHQPNVFGSQRRIPMIWDAENVLQCSRQWGKCGEWIDIPTQDVTWFSTSLPILLGKIICSTVLNILGNYFAPKFIVTIAECPDKTIETSGEKRILFTGKWNSGKASVNFLMLEKPIRIDPMKMYEIVFDTTCVGLRAFHSNWKAETEIDEIIFKFHGLERNDNCMVYSLGFNKITT